MKKSIAIYLPGGAVQSVATVDASMDISSIDRCVEAPNGVCADDGCIRNGVWVAYTPAGAARKRSPPTYRCEWDCDAEDWIDVRSIDEQVSAARVAVTRRRGELLSASDWTQLPDVPLATKEAWATYRQALRDITSQPGYPFNIIWPQAPQ